MTFLAIVLCPSICLARYQQLKSNMNVKSSYIVSRVTKVILRIHAPKIYALIRAVPVCNVFGHGHVSSLSSDLSILLGRMSSSNSDDTTSLPPCSGLVSSKTIAICGRIRSSAQEGSSCPISLIVDAVRPTSKPLDALLSTIKMYASRAVLFNVILATLAVAQSNGTFCNRLYHSSIVVNDKLYVDGGEYRTV